MTSLLSRSSILSPPFVAPLPPMLVDGLSLAATQGATPGSGGSLWQLAKRVDMRQLCKCSVSGEYDIRWSIRRHSSD